MKKLKVYFERHPKLRRISKLLGVVLIVLSFVFNAVIIATAIIQANKPKDTRVLAYGDFNSPQQKSLIHAGNGSYFLGSSDFDFDTFYFNAVNYFGDTFGITYDDTYTYSTNGGHFPMGSIDFCIFEQDSLEFNTYADVNNIRIQKSLVTYTGYEYTGVRYNIALYMNNSYVYVIDYYVYRDVKYFNLSLEGLMVDTEFHYYKSGTSSTYEVHDLYFQVWDTTGILYSLFINNSDKGYSTGYWEGYALGRDDGISYGYSQGYDQGYEDGSLGQLSSNPFTLIGQAFSAVANVLNIQILPNLTLGVLVFTPLIVTIIIVVVKFIRG